MSDLEGQKGTKETGVSRKAGSSAKKVFFGFAVIIVVLIVHPFSILWSVYTAYVFSQQNIIYELGVTPHCTFEGGGVNLDGTDSPDYFCETSEYFDTVGPDYQTKVRAMEEVLINNGWQVTNTPFQAYGDVYYKGHMQIAITGGRPLGLDIHSSDYNKRNIQLMLRDTMFGLWIQHF